MTERMSAQERYDRIADRMNGWWKELDIEIPSTADAFRQAMAEVAGELGEEYAADFEQRLSTQQKEGWPDPALLAELKQRNPDGMETFLDRFQSICEKQRQQYATLLEERGLALPVTEVTQSVPKSKWNRVRELARATVRGFDSLHI